MNTKATPERTFTRRTSTPTNTTSTRPRTNPHPTPTSTPQPRNPLTSNNTDPTPTSTGRMATGLPASCLLPGAVPASRLLLVASAGWPLASAAASEVVRWRTRLGYLGGTLIVGEGSVESSCARYWRKAGDPVEQVADVLAAVEHAHVVLAFLADLDPVVLAVIDRAAEVGVPVVPAHVGGYPFPVGSGQAARAAEGRARSGRR